MTSIGTSKILTVDSFVTEENNFPAGIPYSLLDNYEPLKDKVIFDKQDDQKASFTIKDNVDFSFEGEKYENNESFILKYSYIFNSKPIKVQSVWLDPSNPNSDLSRIGINVAQYKTNNSDFSIDIIVKLRKHYFYFFKINDNILEAKPIASYVTFEKPFEFTEQDAREAFIEEFQAVYEAPIGSENKTSEEVEAEFFAFLNTEEPEKFEEVFLANDFNKNNQYDLEYDKITNELTLLDAAGSVDIIKSKTYKNLCDIILAETIKSYLL